MAGHVVTGQAKTLYQKHIQNGYDLVVMINVWGKIWCWIANWDKQDIIEMS